MRERCGPEANRKRMKNADELYMTRCDMTHFNHHFYFNGRCISALAITIFAYILIYLPLHMCL